MTERYCMLPISVVQVDRERARLCRLTDQYSVAVPVATARIAANCRGLHSLKDHEINISRSFKSEDREIVSESLTALVRLGFLTSEPDLPFVKALPHENRPSRPEITAVAITTNQRARNLESAVRSLIQNAQLNDQSIEISVSDDSKTDYAAAENLEVLRKIEAESPCKIRYSGVEDKRRYIARLEVESGIDRRVLDFAFFGLPDQKVTIGANRNCILLDLIGRPFLFFDDDVVAQATRSRFYRRGIRFSSALSCIHTEYFTDMENVLRSNSFSDVNILAVHGEYLGRRLTDCYSPSNDGYLELDCSAKLWLAALKNAGVVAATQMGLAGHSGQGAPNRLLTMTDDERAFHLHSQEQYRLACTARYVSRMTDMTTITESSFCMTYSLGLDNSQVLPPFFPVARNSDGIFGKALRVTSPNCYIGHLPYGVLHRNPGAQPFSADLIWQDAVRPTISEIMILCLQQAPTLDASAEREARFHQLGEYLVEMGNYGVHKFSKFIQHRLQVKYAKSIVEFENVLERFDGRPAFWANDVRKAIKNIICALESKELGVARDIGQVQGLSQNISLLRSCIRLYGELLATWPSIRKAAMRIAARHEGSGLSKAI